MDRVEEIQTARLRMRRVRQQDLDAIHAIMSDAETMRFWSTPPHATREESQRWLDSMISADRSGASDEFIIEHGGEVIGKMGVWRPPEIGFFLRRDCWGQGFGREALEIFIRHSENRGFEYLTADVDPGNTACLRLLQRCGFVETGRKTSTYMVAGAACDSIFLRRGLTRR